MQNIESFIDWHKRVTTKGDNLQEAEYIGPEQLYIDYEDSIKKLIDARSKNIDNYPIKAQSELIAKYTEGVLYKAGGSEFFGVLRQMGWRLVLYSKGEKFQQVFDEAWVLFSGFMRPGNEREIYSLKYFPNKLIDLSPRQKVDEICDQLVIGANDALLYEYITKYPFGKSTCKHGIFTSEKKLVEAIELFRIMDNQNPNEVKCELVRTTGKDYPLENKDNGFEKEHLVYITQHLKSNNFLTDSVTGTIRSMMIKIFGEAPSKQTVSNATNDTDKRKRFFENLKNTELRTRKS